MKTIALIAQKGGVGKSTIAVNLAVAAGRAVLLDVDPQESAVVWADRRQSGDVHVEFLTERRLSEGLKAAERAGYPICLIDTPPAASPQALIAAELADLILVPCRPSLIDLDAIRRTASMVRSLGKRAYVVFNATPVRASTLLHEAASVVAETGLVVAPVVLHERGAFRAAWPLGLGVTEWEPSGRAAAEIAHLNVWACDAVNIIAPEGVSHA